MTGKAFFVDILDGEKEAVMDYGKLRQEAEQVPGLSRTRRSVCEK